LTTLSAFSDAEAERAKLYLATTVAAMMGRKFEEDDWAKVYAAAKGFTASAWSNFDVDVMQGNLGVEHKMIGRSGGGSLLECCGRSIMHPAGTRAIRFPRNLTDPNAAARDVLRQYGRKIEERSLIVRLINRYHHSESSRDQAIVELTALGMGRDKALELVPADRTPRGSPWDEPDMRFGWFIWRRDLAEFLYFEKPMVAPDPSEFFGEWHERRTSGRRLPSRNLWIFRHSTGSKEYSITTDAGSKVQPYFTVPPPRDPNLYHFRVQGETTDDGLVRVWLTYETAQALRSNVLDTSPAALSKFVRERSVRTLDANAPARSAFEPPAVQFLISRDAYTALRADHDAVSDEHAFRLLLNESAD
jgi:hypothetical protein